MKKKSMLIVAILLMSIGFAAISTTLVINGNANVSENNEDFSVIFTAASIDGNDVYTTAVDDTKKIITFTTSELKTLNQTSVLTYEVTNNSSNYDANVTITCVPKEGTTAKYTSIKNKLDNDATVVKAKESVNGTLTITLDKTSTEEVSEEYTCKLEFNAVERDTLGVKTTNLYNLIETKADKTTVIDYKIRSGVSGTNGIYTTTQTEGNTPVYYFRGDAEKVNNNIIFNNMCWKIIRTTETGGIKIIYNGIPVDGKCETQTGETTQIGKSEYNSVIKTGGTVYPDEMFDNIQIDYMYGTAKATTYEDAHANINDSVIKTYIDNWYNQNFDTTTTAKLEDTVFCNDRSTKAYDTNTIGDSKFSRFGTGGYNLASTLYSASHRVSYLSKSPNPSLVCQNANDKFTVDTKNGNGVLTYPVGLITLDEVVLAGFNTYYSNTGDYKDTTNYLYTNSVYWTLTPVVMCDNYNSLLYNPGAYIGCVADGISHCEATGYSSSPIGVRPVVSLVNGTLVASTGDGTSTNPYVVE